MTTPPHPRPEEDVWTNAAKCFRSSIANPSGQVPVLECRQTWAAHRRRDVGCEGCSSLQTLGPGIVKFWAGPPCQGCLSCKGRVPIRQPKNADRADRPRVPAPRKSRHGSPGRRHLDGHPPRAGRRGLNKNQLMCRPPAFFHSQGRLANYRWSAEACTMTM
ncbi:hypothetical protein GQ53DRAFT_451195 [Thozetella sp. PMI_491]|nr:hypothetical protein GQ53DRAFT_451195 [Thozetella sp. PMI_491]